MRASARVTLLLLALLATACDDDSTVSPPPPDSCNELSGYTRQLAIVRPDARVFDADANLSHIFTSAQGAGVFAASFDAPDQILQSPALASLDARAVDADNHLLYVASADGGLAIVNVSNPAGATIMGVAEMPGAAVDVRVVGDLAYVANAQTGLVIVDVSNPALPVLRGIENTPGEASSVDVDGDVAVVADLDLGVRVVNVTNPDSPFLIKAVDVDGAALAIAIEDGRVAVAAREGDLVLIDAGVPALAEVVTSVPVQFDAFAVALHNAVAYVGDSFASVRVLDVRDLASPRPVHNIGVVSSAQGVTVADNRLLVADDIAGARVFDIGATADAPPTRKIAGMGAISSMLPYGDYVVTTEGDFRLRVVDPVAGTIVGNVFIPSPPIDVFIADTLAYVTTNSFFVYQVSLNDVANPYVARSFRGVNDFDACVVADGLIYQLESGSSTVLESHLDGTGAPRAFTAIDAFFPSIAVDGPYLYLPDRRGNVWIVIRSSMTLSATLPVGGSAERVLIRYEDGPFIPLQRVFVATSGLSNGVASVEKWDFTVHFSPVLLSEVAVGGNAVDLAVNDERLLVAEGSDGAELFELPEGASAGLLRGPVSRVALVRGLLVLASNQGLFTVDPAECLQ